MKMNVSVEQAIRKGKFTILYVMVSLLISIPIVTIVLMYQYENQFILGLWLPIALWTGLILGFITMKLYWNYASLQWQLWAFENVKNVHELKTKALRNRLISNNNFIVTRKFETNDFNKQKALLRIKKKFEEKDIYHDTFNVPKETIIKTTISGSLLIIAIVLFFLIIGIKAIFTIENYKFYYAIPLVIGTIILFLVFKSIFQKEPEIILNSLGIKFSKKNFMTWEFINDEYIEIEDNGNYKSHYITLHYKNVKERFLIGTSLSKSPEQIENLLRIYRLRHEKNNSNL